MSQFIIQTVQKFEEFVRDVLIQYIYYVVFKKKKKKKIYYVTVAQYPIF